MSVADYRRYTDWFYDGGFWALLVLDLIVLQAATGFTVGKVALGIRTVERSGTGAGWRRTLTRSLPLVIEQLGLFGLWNMRRHPEHQRIGDRWADTLVVRATGTRAPHEIEPPGQARRF